MLDRGMSRSMFGTCGGRYFPVVERVISVRDGRGSLVGSDRRCQGKGEGRTFFMENSQHNVIKTHRLSISSKQSVCVHSRGLALS